MIAGDTNLIKRLKKTPTIVETEKNCDPFLDFRWMELLLKDLSCVQDKLWPKQLKVKTEVKRGKNQVKTDVKRMSCGSVDTISLETNTTLQTFFAL